MQQTFHILQQQKNDDCINEQKQCIWFWNILYASSTPQKDQLAISYFVDDPKSSGHSSVSRVSLHSPTYTYSNMMLRGHILEILKLSWGASTVDLNLQGDT